MASEQVAAATTIPRSGIFTPRFDLPLLNGIYESLAGDGVDVNSDLEDLIRYGACVLAIVDHTRIEFQEPIKTKLSGMAEIADCLLEDGGFGP